MVMVEAVLQISIGHRTISQCEALRILVKLRRLVE